MVFPFHLADKADGVTELANNKYAKDMVNIKETRVHGHQVCNSFEQQ